MWFLHISSSRSLSVCSNGGFAGGNSIATLTYSRAAYPCDPVGQAVFFFSFFWDLSVRLSLSEGKGGQS
jgi:hypothetical protein